MEKETPEEFRNRLMTIWATPEGERKTNNLRIEQIMQLARIAAALEKILDGEPISVYTKEG